MNQHNLTIQKLSPSDIDTFVELLRVFDEVFETENPLLEDTVYLRTLLEGNGFWVFVAFLDNVVVGGLTAYTLHQYISKSPLIYIYDLAVKTAFQRQGIGKRLIADITAYSREAGMEEVFVQADVVDDYALDFYRSTGATPEDVVHFYYPLKGQ